MTAVVMRACHRTDAGVYEAIAGTGTRRSPWSPRTPGTVVRIVWVGQVINVNPSLRGMSAHIANNFSIGGTPRQPHRILRHARADLALTYECLIMGRKTLINFGILGNAVLSCLATCKNQRARCEANRQQLGKN